jgi:DNA repair photolyase
MTNVNDLMYFFTSYLGINPAHGCNSGCGYCILEKDNPNPTKIVKSSTAKFTLEMILKSDKVSKINPITFYNQSDPFLKQNIPDLMHIIEGMEKNNYQNPLILITKLNPDKTDQAVLKEISQLKNLKPVIMVTYANVPKKVEPVSKSGRIELMARSKELGIPVVQYARPLWEKWTPFDKVQEMVSETADKVDSVIVGGLVVSNEIKAKLKRKNVVIPSWDNDKGRFLNSNYRKRIINEYKRVNPDLGIFVNSSCGISAALKVPNYMGYQVGFKRSYNQDNCSRPCSAKQKEICYFGEPPIKSYDPEENRVKFNEENAKVINWLKKFDVEKAMYRIKDGHLNIFARLNTEEIRMMRQHTGMYIYCDRNFKNIKNKEDII